MLVAQKEKPTWGTAESSLLYNRPAPATELRFTLIYFLLSVLFSLFNTALLPPPQMELCRRNHARTVTIHNNQQLPWGTQHEVCSHRSRIRPGRAQRPPRP
jgi:hypothetical protein